MAMCRVHNTIVELSAAAEEEWQFWQGLIDELGVQASDLEAYRSQYEPDFIEACICHQDKNSRKRMDEIFTEIAGNEMYDIFTEIADFVQRNPEPKSDEMKTSIHRILSLYHALDTVHLRTMSPSCRRRVEYTLYTIGQIDRRVERGDYDLVDVPMLYWQRFG